MKTYAFEEPAGLSGTKSITIKKTEEEIIKEYFPYWSERMKKIGKEDQISEENCIEDWVISNWAVEVK